MLLVAPVSFGGDLLSDRAFRVERWENRKRQNEPYLGREWTYLPVYALFISGSCIGIHETV